MGGKLNWGRLYCIGGGGGNGGYGAGRSVILTWEGEKEYARGGGSIFSIGRNRIHREESITAGTDCTGVVCSLLLWRCMGALFANLLSFSF